MISVLSISYVAAKHLLFDFERNNSSQNASFKRYVTKKKREVVNVLKSFKKISGKHQYETPVLAKLKSPGLLPYWKRTLLHYTLKVLFRLIQLKYVFLVKKMVCKPFCVCVVSSILRRLTLTGVLSL